MLHKLNAGWSVSGALALYNMQMHANDYSYVCDSILAVMQMQQAMHCVC